VVVGRSRVCMGTGEIGLGGDSFSGLKYDYTHPIVRFCPMDPDL
jgi:hypothetical protein